jgi:PAS domain S-box-containing protein
MTADKTRKPTVAKLRCEAEASLRKRQKHQADIPSETRPTVDTHRLLHELQVHQIELEMQNAELHKARDSLETLLERYTDLYDFSPVGYFTLGTEGQIQLVNLTGATLAGTNRVKLIGHSFTQLITPDQRPAFRSFLEQIFASETNQKADFHLLRPDRTAIIVKIRAQRSISGLECSAVVVDITERIKAEAKIHHSEVRYRRLFEAAHDGVLLIDPRTRLITDANPFMTTLLGYTHDELVGKELFEIGLLKDEAASQEMFYDLKKTHQVRYEDLPLKSQDGRLQEVEVVANLYLENGHPVIQCNIRDITERKRAEHDIRLKGSALAAVANAIFITDHEGIIQYTNPAFSALSGYSAAETIGKKASLVRSDVHSDSFFNEIWQTILSGQSWSGQITNIGKNKKLYVSEQSISPFKDDSGKISHFVSVQRDITERLRVEDAIKRSEVLFSSLIAQSPVGVYVVGANFQLQQINPKALPSFINVRPLIGRDYAEIVHSLWPKRVAAKIVAHFRHTLKTGEPYQSPEFSERRKDTGEYEAYEWQIQRVTLPAGELGVVCFFNDITERKRAEWVRRRLDILTASNVKLEAEVVQRQAVEKTLKRSEEDQRRLLKQAQHMQKQLRSFSHQIITAQEDERKRISRELHDVIAQTLVGINVHLGALTRAAEGTSKSLLVKIHRTQQLVEKAADTVHQFARELRPTVLDDLGLIPALEAHLKGFTADTGVRAALKVTADIESMIGSRRTALYRIVQEALTNVARHAKATFVSITLQSLTASTIRMTITDDGQGFFIDDALATGKSKRLGLLGMKERIEMIDGTFCIESVPGQSTIVRVDLPVLA